MALKAARELVQKKQLFPLLALSKLLTPFYRLSFIAALVENGYLHLLAGRSLTLAEIMSGMHIGQGNADDLVAWLQVGRRLGEIRLEAGQYRLSGISQTLSKVVENDALLAMTEEVASLHHKLILDTPKKFREGQKWTLTDQDGELIARSSRIVEAFLNEAIDTVFRETKPVRLLEVGCGSGIYIKRAATLNPQLTALGVELQPAVADMARRNIGEWGLSDRVKIEAGDIRGKELGGAFDIVTLYNNIYYFPVPERVALLQHLGSFLKPGGSLVLVTGCQGGQPVMELLNLWSAATEGCARLPEADEMVAQMKDAGLGNVRKQNLMPGDSFYMFAGERIR